MAEAIAAFFEAWSTTGPARKAQLAKVTARDVYYADPNTPEPLVGLDALDAHLDMFTRHMPGASARVAVHTAHHGHVRATVDFLNNGAAMMRGQYFADLDADGKLCRIVGFTGTGEES
jgi:hypothetical protein